MGQTVVALTGFRNEHGLVWPAYDQRCAEVSFDEVDRLVPLLLRHVPQTRVAVQAGGNCGQLVVRLAAEFDAVYTFEPDPKNFVALTVNTAQLPGVFRFQAALGSERGLRGLADGDGKFPGANCGALYMAGAGAVPTLAIDDLGLTACDLIMLDVEGGEFSALRSAAWTIAICRPVVVIEDKGLGSRFYSEAPRSAEIWLTEHHGYRRAARIDNDTIMVSA